MKTLDVEVLERRHKRMVELDYNDVQGDRGMVTSLSGGALKPVCMEEAMTGAGVPRLRSFVRGTSVGRVQMGALLSWPIECQGSYR